MPANAISNPLPHPPASPDSPASAAVPHTPHTHPLQHPVPVPPSTTTLTWTTWDYLRIFGVWPILALLTASIGMILAFPPGIGIAPLALAPCFLLFLALSAGACLLAEHCYHLHKRKKARQRYGKEVELALHNTHTEIAQKTAQIRNHTGTLDPPFNQVIPQTLELLILMHRSTQLQQEHHRLLESETFGHTPSFR